MKYNINDDLVFIGDIDPHKFETGKRYKITGIGKVDYDSVDVEPKDCIYFEGCDYGCYTDYADEHFIRLDELRNDKIGEILK